MPAVAKVDLDKLLELSERNIKQTVMAGELGVSVPTLAKIIAELKDKQGILLRYRELQSLQLTSIQARILEHITPEKIQEASLRDLVLAFKILKDKEHVIEGKPSEIKGLIGYLIELEKKELANVEYTEEEVAAALQAGREASEVVDVTDPDYVPSL